MRKSFLILFCVAASATTIVADDKQINVAHPDWSPDGTQLAFAANWDGAENIYVMNVDGSHVRQLTFGKAMDSYPRYAPDGKWLAFLSRRHELFSMHFMRADGRDERALLPAIGNLEPAVSPDGQWVAYRSYLDGVDLHGEVMIVRVSGGNPSRLTENNVEDGYPTFSVDGRELFFHRVIGEYRQIMRLDLESGTETQLTLGDCNSWHAHPSPDGHKIVYDSDCGGNRDIYSLDFENHHVMQLTTESSRDDYPKFSPDGKQIAFHSDRRGSTEIFIMAADGNQQTLLTPQPPPYSSADEQAIRAVILDFVEGCYAGDTERVARAFHPDLDKSGFGVMRDGRIVSGTHTYDEIVEECRTLYTERLTLPDNPRIDITIFDVLTLTASAKAEVEWGIDYFHLSKVNDKWRIKNGLGQSYPRN